MAAVEYYISGKCKWAKLFRPDTKYEPQYSIQLYPNDWSEYEAMGLGGRAKEDEDGKFVTFRRKLKTAWSDDIGPPEVVDAKGNKLEALVGNGSEVTLKVEAYQTAKGPGHRFTKVRVDNLVEYVRAEGGEAPEGATEGKPAVPKKGLPF